MGDYASTGGRSLESRISEADKLWENLSDAEKFLVLLDTSGTSTINFLNQLARIIGESEVNSYLRIKNEQRRERNKRRPNS